VIKSCCGNKSFIFETEKPVKKIHLDTFRKSGYLVPEHFVNVGLFYVQFEGLIATAAFGSTRIQIRCNSRNSDELLSKFQLLLDQTTLSV
jgi:hypothetical protein